MAEMQPGATGTAKNQPKDDGGKKDPGQNGAPPASSPDSKPKSK